MRKFLSLVSVLTAIAIFPLNSWALSITSTVYDQEYYTGIPITPQVGPVLVNGDFTIIDHDETSTSLLGDGINDRTNWMFDFRTDSYYLEFLSVEKLSSACLILELTPMDWLIINDAIEINGLAPYFAPEIAELDVGVTSIIQIELLDFYSSSDLINVFNDNFGMVTAQYADDSIVSFASLNLASCAPAQIPEPGTMLLFSTGLMSLAGLIRKKGSSGESVGK